MSRCSYKGCKKRRGKESSTVSFFTVPDDHRRNLWLKHARCYSVNKHIFICDAHFYKKDIMHQFGMKRLLKDAVPKSSSSVCSCSKESFDESCFRLMGLEEDINLRYQLSNTKSSSIPNKESSLSHPNSPRSDFGNEVIVIKDEYEDYVVTDLTTADYIKNAHKIEKNELDHKELEEKLQFDSLDSKDNKPFIDSPLLSLAKANTTRIKQETIANLNGYK